MTQIALHESSRRSLLQLAVLPGSGAGNAVAGGIVTAGLPGFEEPRRRKRARQTCCETSDQECTQPDGTVCLGDCCREPGGRTCCRDFQGNLELPNIFCGAELAGSTCLFPGFGSPC